MFTVTLSNWLTSRISGVMKPHRTRQIMDGGFPSIILISRLMFFQPKTIGIFFMNMLYYKSNGNF